MAFNPQYTSMYERNLRRKQLKLERDRFEREKEHDKWTREKENLLFQLRIKESQQKEKDRKKKQEVTDNLEILESLNNAVELYRNTGQESVLKPALTRIATEERSNLLPIAKGLIEGDDVARKQYDMFYNSALNKAYQMGIREAPKNYRPEIKVAKNKKTGALEYVNVLNPEVRKTHVPPDDDQDPNWKPAIERKTGKLVLADYNDPKLADNYDPVPKDGMKFEFNESGQLLGISMGGASAQVSKPTTREAEKDIVTARDSLARLDDIRASYDPKFLTYQGKVSDWMNRTKDKAQIDLSKDERADLAKRRQFTQSVDREFNAYRKLITGAAASVQELESLKKAMLSTDLSPVEFEAAFDTYRRELQRTIRLRSRLLREGLELGSREFGESMDKLFLANEDDSALLRGEELEKVGKSDEEIIHTLQAEGYRLRSSK